MTSQLVLSTIGEVNDLSPSAEAIWRLVAAALLGALVGLEREVSDQPAGLRTHLTVALGAAMFGVVSTLGFSEFVTDQRAVNIQFDVTRVASQVVVGIGFLGAGIIFRSGSTVRNLTTAASLWACAAIGLAAGVGDIGIAGVATAALIAALLLLRFPRDLIRRRLTRASSRVSIRLRNMGVADDVLAAIDAIDGLTVVELGWSKTDEHPMLDLTLEAEPRTRPEALLRDIIDRPDVMGVRTEASLQSQVTVD